MTTDSTPTSAPAQADTEDIQYARLLASIRDHFATATAEGTKLFATSATGLFDVFLAELPTDRRQHYTCNCCRRFIERFGGLVTLDADGSARPVVWDPETTPPLFRPSAQAIVQRIGRSSVNGVFLSPQDIWGTPETPSGKPPGSGPSSWHHMAVLPRKELLYRPTPLLTASQAMAEKVQDFETLSRGLAEFSVDVVRQAHTLLTTGGLYRSEKCIGVAKWLLELHEARENTRHTTARANLTWRAVASAPAGFCHVRSTMIGTLLEDIVAGLDFPTIKRRFDEKMHPLQYQRPQAAPSDGQIAAAEKVVAALGSAGALERRFARLEDVEALWRPAPAKPKPDRGGVFGHLKTPATPAPTVTPPTVAMTWEKFQRTVLTEAERIEFYVPPTRAGYVGLITAANPDAPPILQWDGAARRNPVGWYFYEGGRPPQDWNLKPSSWVDVTAVTLQPSMWHGGFEHQGAGVYFLLEGAKDVRYAAGAGLFPECLRSEYHAIRATIEAHARRAVVKGLDEATAFGIGLPKGAPGQWDHLFRVTSKGGARVTYKLDRWD